MNAHTLGPRVASSTRVFSEKTGAPVAFRPIFWSAGMRQPEADAYARLIAAAPDMLQALLFAEHYCPCGARPESPHTHPHVPGCVIAAAIAKARGS